MNRRTFIVSLLAAAIFMLLMVRKKPSEVDYQEAACAGPPLKTTQARNDALEAGYSINQRYDCIDKASFEAINRQQAAWEKSRSESTGQRPAPPVSEPKLTLGEARHGFRTALSQPSSRTPPLPQPPAHLFVRADYRNPQNLILPAYITPDPKDGQKHPAILWLTGGDTNSLTDFWTPGPEANDQSARAFREAGLVMMFPTLRGGNDNPGSKEFFFGEVDDVLAAADHLARQSYVDADRLYLGGHSTGGTLALLTAEMSGRFKAVFAFGPVASVDRYPPSLIPVDFRQQGELELRLRSPIHWLSGISTPTYVIEGDTGPGNIDDMEEICRNNRNPLLRCIPVHGLDHFSVILKASRVIAARLAVNTPDVDLSLRPDEFSK